MGRRSFVSMKTNLCCSNRAMTPVSYHFSTTCSKYLLAQRHPRLRRTFRGSWGMGWATMREEIVSVADPADRRGEKYLIWVQVWAVKHF